MQVRLKSCFPFLSFIIKILQRASQLAGGLVEDTHTPVAASYIRFFISYGLCLALPRAKAITRPEGHLRVALFSSSHDENRFLPPPNQQGLRFKRRQIEDEGPGGSFGDSFTPFGSPVVGKPRGSSLTSQPENRQVLAQGRPQEEHQEGWQHRTAFSNAFGLLQASQNTDDDSVGGSSSGGDTTDETESSTEGSSGKDTSSNGEKKKKRKKLAKGGVRGLGAKIKKRVQKAVVRLSHDFDEYLGGNLMRTLRRLSTGQPAPKKRSTSRPVGTGLDAVARAVENAPKKPAHASILDRAKAAIQSQFLNSFFPKGRRLAFESLRDGRNLSLERQETIAAGPSYLLINFLGDNDMVYAAKIFWIRGSGSEAQKLVESQMEVLNVLPRDEHLWTVSQRLQLALPLNVVRLRDEGQVLSVPAGENMLNMLILHESFPLDLAWLSKNLDPSSEGDNVVRESLTAQAVKCLKNLHSLGLIHGAVKPQNILIGTDGLVFLSDFGISPVETAKAAVATAAQYLAPEVAKALRSSEGPPFTPAVDSWSLGVVLYELWCRKLPFRLPTFGTDTLASVAGLTAESVALDYQCIRHLLPEIRDLLNNLLKFDPAARLGLDKVPQSLLSLAEEAGKRGEAQAEVKTG
ncbi:hypothetical protein Efla_000633 [Eimeria flavescens]